MKRTDKQAVPPMRRQEEIVKMLKNGGSVLKYHQEMGHDSNYVRGVIDALRWVLREGENPMR